MRATHCASTASTRAVQRTASRGASSPPPPRRRRAHHHHRATTTNDEDAYNAAMIAYSATPYEYKHELGLCTCSTSVDESARLRA